MPPLPTIAIIGRPNVGKSLLFNRLVRQQQSIVHQQPGMTLDFLQAPLTHNHRCATLVDTGGVGGGVDDWTETIVAQMQKAARLADYFLLVVDAKAGLLAGDEELMKALRRHHQKPWRLVVNKCDGQADDSKRAEIVKAEFYQLGAEKIFTISAKTGAGITHLRDGLCDWMRADGVGDGETADKNSPPRIAVIGRPNVGKSTFVNRLLKAPRMVVDERAGTTRDCVANTLHHPQGAVVLYDTAGMRRTRATAAREKLSVAMVRQLLHNIDGCFLLFDISEGITHQDKRIAALAEAAGCAITPIANKADQLVARLGKTRLAERTATLLPSTPHQPFLLSALGNKPLPTTALLKSLRQSIRQQNAPLPTHRIAEALRHITAAHPPPRSGRIRPKLRYAHIGSRRPFSIVVHGNAIDRVPLSYKRYLTAAFAQEFGLVGVPVKVILKGDANPYAG